MRRWLIAPFPSVSCANLRLTARAFWPELTLRWNARSEISQHIEASTADIASWRGAAWTCAGWRLVHASGNCAALARGTRRVSPTAIYGSLLSYCETFCRTGTAGRGFVASRKRSDQLPGKTGFAFTGTACSGAISRTHAGVQRLRGAVHGTGNGLFCARRDAAVDCSRSNIRGYRKCRGTWISGRGWNSCGYPVSVKAHQ